MEKQETDVDRHWKAMMDTLIAYKKRYNHTFIPRTYGRLGQWAHDQRVHYYLLKSGKPSQMTQEKIEQLEAHGFSWENENKRSLKWREMYDKLVEFHAEFGHCDVSKNSSKLGSWVDYQRCALRKFMKNDGVKDTTRKRRTDYNLLKKRIALLNKLGFRWSSEGEEERKKRTEKKATTCTPPRNDVEVDKKSPTRKTTSTPRIMVPPRPSPSSLPTGALVTAGKRSLPFVSKVEILMNNPKPPETKRSNCGEASSSGFSGTVTMRPPKIIKRSELEMRVNPEVPIAFSGSYNPCAVSMQEKVPSVVAVSRTPIVIAKAPSVSFPSMTHRMQSMPVPPRQRVRIVHARPPMPTKISQYVSSAPKKRVVRIYDSSRPVYRAKYIHPTNSTISHKSVIPMRPTSS